MAISKDKERIAISLTKEQVTEFSEVAKEIGITKSALMQIATIKYVNEYRKIKERNNKMKIYKIVKNERQTKIDVKYHPFITVEGDEVMDEEIERFINKETAIRKLKEYESNIHYYPSNKIKNIEEYMILETEVRIDKDGEEEEISWLGYEEIAKLSSLAELKERNE